jgi:hypothetical protein
MRKEEDDAFDPEKDYQRKNWIQYQKLKRDEEDIIKFKRKEKRKISYEDNYEEHKLLIQPEEEAKVELVKPEPEIPDILKIRKPVYNPEDFAKKKRKRKSYRYNVVKDGNITYSINESEPTDKLENSKNEMEIPKNEGEVIEASLNFMRQYK